METFLTLFAEQTKSCLLADDRNSNVEIPFLQVRETSLKYKYIIYIFLKFDMLKQCLTINWHFTNKNIVQYFLLKYKNLIER